MPAATRCLGACAALLALTAAGLPARAETPAQRAAEAKAYLAAIARLDDAEKGPQLNAVIVANPAAPQEAARLAGAGPLDGRTVLIKDNVETSEWPTTAGSLALATNKTGRDAPMIARLRAAGGVVLGKTNLSEWANIRHSPSTSGWSAVGGLTRNPHAIDRNTCGSSSGSGAAIAAGMAWGAIGTETDGSITCPAAVNGIVGFKPTVGMVSRTHVVPISASQDTAGPMTRSVTDAALLLNAIAGSDPADPATAEADARKTDFTQGLATASLKGMRIGLLTRAVGNHPGVRKVFEQAVADLKAAGAEIVEIDFQPDGTMFRDEGYVLRYELRRDMNAYLKTLPGTGLPRSLTELIEFNRANADKELRWFGQDTFIAADKLTDADAYAKARANSLKLAGELGIDKLLADNKVSLLIAPTAGPAWSTDLVTGDRFLGIGAGSLAAIAGYPHLTVPMGAVEGLPVGLSFMGAKWKDHAVLQAGAAYERSRTASLPRPAFKRWAEQHSKPLRNHPNYRNGLVVKQSRSSETRNRIVTAARELFLAKGFDGTAVAEVCRAAGVSNGALFHQFPTKEELGFAVYTLVRREFWNRVMAAMLAPEDPLDGIEAAVRAAFAFQLEEPGSAAFMFDVSGSKWIEGFASQSQEVHDIVSGRGQAWAAPHIAAGRLPPVPPDVFVALASGAPQWIGRMSRIGMNAFPLEVIAEQMPYYVRRAFTPE